MQTIIHVCKSCRAISFGANLCGRCIGQSKIAICRSNQCGHYDAANDACTILTNKGKSGAIAYLANHPLTSCVDTINHFAEVESAAVQEPSSVRDGCCE